MEIGLDVITVFGFFSLVGVLLVLDRKNVEFNYGLIIRRWKHGQYVMDKWIFSHRKFLNAFGTVGVVVGFVAAAFGIVSILYATVLGQQSVSPILPTVGEYQYPSGIVGVPFWFWIISIFVVLSVHEPMHAIFARLAGVPVRSWGVMTFFVLPLGAFVDPDMRKVYRLTLMQKLKIFAGGSFGNFMTAAVVLLVLIASSYIMFGQANVPGGPADVAGLEGTIEKVGSVEITHIGNLSSVLNATESGSTIQVATDRGTYEVVTAANPTTGHGSYIGVTFGLRPEYMAWKESVSVFMQLLKWLLIFNIGIGVFNMIPMKPFDGGHVFEAVFAKVLKSEKAGKTAINITSVAVLGILLFNVFGTGIVKALFI
ncbi:MAG: site-2 protease family protein [Candidatus Aenigmarchaeota archaeon]|nr:site-2 protease family protein [Candidatus Aenigmarchaeota archaeon]